MCMVTSFRALIGLNQLKYAIPQALVIGSRKGNWGQLDVVQFLPERTLFFPLIAWEKDRNFAVNVPIL